MSVTGHPDNVPGGGPMKVGIAIADLTTGLYATTMICAALYERKTTGVGRFIDLALLDTQVASMANMGWNYLVTGENPERLGNSVPSLVPYEAFRTSNGHMIVAVGNDSQYSRFCNVIGRPDLAVDSRFLLSHDRVRYRATLTEIIKPVLASRPTEEWIDVFESVGVPSGPINRMSQVYSDPQVVHRGLKMTLPHSTLGDTVAVASPVKIDGGPLDYGRGAPTLGEHSEEVIADWLGSEPGEKAIRNAAEA